MSYSKKKNTMKLTGLFFFFLIINYKETKNLNLLGSSEIEKGKSYSYKHT